MSTSENKRVEDLSDWYLKEQLDLDKRLIRYRYQNLKPHFRGTNALELGPAEGEMTRFLRDDFRSLTVVDGAKELLNRIPASANLTKVHSLFEQYKPENKFDTIILEHILEHVEDPVGLLSRVRNWLLPKGVMLIGVPNAHSLHRLAAVKMGLLKTPNELNPRDHALGHRRVYTMNTLKAELEKAALKVLVFGGVFLKPLSNQQIQNQWSEEMIEGFYELGKDLPEYAAEIFAVCEL